MPASEFTFATMRLTVSMPQTEALVCSMRPSISKQHLQRRYGLRQRPMQVGAGMIPLDYAEIDARVVVALEGQGNRPLQLIKLYDDGLVAARVDNSISSVDDSPFHSTMGQGASRSSDEGGWVVYMSWSWEHTSP